VRASPSKDSSKASNGAPEEADDSKPIIERFGTQKEEEPKPSFEMETYLKTKSANLRSYYLKLFGSEAYFYKAREDTTHDFMHSLKGTFIKEKGYRLVDKSGPEKAYCLKI